jgi:hypothetical protein
MEKFISIEKSHGSKYLINPNKIKNIEYHDSDTIWFDYTDGKNDRISFPSDVEAQEAYDSILNQLT